MGSTSPSRKGVFKYAAKSYHFSQFQTLFPSCLVQNLVPIFQYPLFDVLYWRSMSRVTSLLRLHKKAAANQRPPYMSLPHRAVTDYPFSNMQGSRTLWYEDTKTWVGVASATCLTIFGVLASKEDDDSRVWGVFLGVGVLFSLMEFVLIAMEYHVLCFTRRTGNEHPGEAHV